MHSYSKVYNKSKPTRDTSNTTTSSNSDYLVYNFDLNSTSVVSKQKNIHNFKDDNKEKEQVKTTNGEADFVEFKPLLSPLISLTTTYGKDTKSPTFFLHKNGINVILSWEPFYGDISSSGAEEILISQDIKWLPSYPVEIPIVFYHKSNQHIGILKVTIDQKYQVRFAFPQGLKIKSNDRVDFPGSSVSWLSF